MSSVFTGVFPLIFSFTFLLSLQHAHAAIGPIADLHIINADIAPDGFSRPAVLAGGTFPGPLIVGQKGGDLEINVHDDLTNADMFKSTSIHWHGIDQRRSNWADGVTSVTQCPITSGESFLYKFNVNDQAGTFWYHSHLSTQYCDGLRGPMVIYDPLDPHRALYDIDDESTVLTVGDWYHTLSRKTTGLPVPDSTLINGLGRSSSGPADAALAVITVQRGKRYRFRLVSISCDANYIFSIHSHALTIIEADGTSTLPVKVDSLQIFAGQRYSFVLEANQPVSNYWIRAMPNVGNTTFKGGINSAILRYAGAPEAEPTTPDVQSKRPLREVDLHPLIPSIVPGFPLPLPGQDFVTHNLLLGYDFHFTVDGVSYTPPSVPVLLQILSGKRTAHDLLPDGSVISLPSNAVVELTMPAGVVGGPHPLHLHGHSFHVIRSAGSSTYNYLNPIKRDVVNSGVAGDNVTIRFVADNSGPWFLHCHIDDHLVNGFAVVFAEAINKTSSEVSVPSAWKELCPKYDALSPSDQ
ncbi:laccase [Panus rudis PR-1116 ss-1]|nr:laccase [Panus rudis PR-1116 ss-1]